jgi:hypothetical protein
MIPVKPSTSNKTTAYAAEESSDASLCVSICALAAAVPALIGS